MHRRHFLAMGGAVLASGLAGCSNEYPEVGENQSDNNSTQQAGDTDSGESAAGNNSTLRPDTSGPVAIVESFYAKVQELDSSLPGEVIVDELDGYLHTESPFRELVVESGGSNAERKIAGVEASLAEENLSEAQLEEQFGLGFLDVPEKVIADIATENATVSTTIRYASATSQSTEHLTATENGDWLMVI